MPTQTSTLTGEVETLLARLAEAEQEHANPAVARIAALRSELDAKREQLHVTQTAESKQKALRESQDEIARLERAVTSSRSSITRWNAECVALQEKTWIETGRMNQSLRRLGTLKGLLGQLRQGEN